MFFDLEGDAFALDGGLEYLFGVADRDDNYNGSWALDPASEKPPLPDADDRPRRLGGACGARRHVAAAPRDLPGRVVRAARAAGPWGLTGPRPPCVARRLLEQQCREPPVWRAQQEHRRQPERQHRFSRFEHALEPELPRSRPRRARVGASRADHDEPAPPEESGGVTAGARPGPRGRRAPAVVCREILCVSVPRGPALRRFFAPGTLASAAAERGGSRGLPTSPSSSRCLGVRDAPPAASQPPAHPG